MILCLFIGKYIVLFTYVERNVGPSHTSPARRCGTFQQNLLVFSTLTALLDYKLRRYGVREISEVGEQGAEHDVAIDRDSGCERQNSSISLLTFYGTHERAVGLSFSRPTNPFYQISELV